MSYATIGAVVSGIDLAATLSNQQVEDPDTALPNHQVLYFRDEKINLDHARSGFRVTIKGDRPF
jgi:alpha-ketoglutarate-dependent taurine dioxygenase